MREPRLRRHRRRVVPVETLRKFLEAQSVTPATGRTGADAAKAAVVRVICVRK